MPRRPVLRTALAVVLLVLSAPATASGQPTSRSTRSEPATFASASRPVPARGEWPLRPRPQVVAGFSAPATRYGAGHRGVDLVAGPLAPVRTSLAGTVAFAGRIAGRGVVVVDHGGTRTTYEPVAAQVAVGDPVTAGEVIGRLELFGSHCFPRWCLHWGLIEGREHYLDPLVLVGALPVRLLPLDGRAPMAAVPGARVSWPSAPAPGPALPSRLDGPSALAGRGPVLPAVPPRRAWPRSSE